MIMSPKKDIDKILGGSPTDDGAEEIEEMDEVEVDDDADETDEA